MFRHLSDEVITFLTKGEIAANECEVVGFTSPAGEYNLVGHASKERSNLASGTIESRLGGARSPVIAGWISEGILQQWQHGGDHPRIDGLAGVVVEIDSRHLYNDLTGSLCFRTTRSHCAIDLTPGDGDDNIRKFNVSAPITRIAAAKP